MYAGTFGLRSVQGVFEIEENSGCTISHLTERFSSRLVGGKTI
jgi:hypothetical protein